MSARFRWLAAGLFLATLATLILEVLDTRLLSVLTWYHLSFLAVSVAMLGMAAGAVTRLPRRRAVSSATRVTSSLPRYTLWFALAIPARHLANLAIPIPFLRQFAVMEFVALAVATIVLAASLRAVRHRGHAGADADGRADWPVVCGRPLWRRAGVSRRRSRCSTCSNITSVGVRRRRRGGARRAGASRGSGGADSWRPLVMAGAARRHRARQCDDRSRSRRDLSQESNALAGPGPRRDARRGTRTPTSSSRSRSRNARFSGAPGVEATGFRYDLGVDRHRRRSRARRSRSGTATRLARLGAVRRHRRCPITSGAATPAVIGVGGGRDLLSALWGRQPR